MTKIEILSKKDNTLFSREEIEFKVTDSNKTPSREDVKNLLIANTKQKEGQIIIKKINSIFGSNIATGIAYVYKNAEIMKKIEPKHILKRNEKKEKKPEEKPVEAKPEEKKPEPAKEEVSQK